MLEARKFSTVLPRAVRYRASSGNGWMGLGTFTRQ